MNTSCKDHEIVTRRRKLKGHLPFAFALASFTVACGAVFPEFATPTRQPPTGYTLEPPPPQNLVYLGFARATIPDRTRDGRAWDAVGGSLPDPFAKLIVDGKDLVVTPAQSNTLSPTWPNQTRANHQLAPDARIRVELWDTNPINNHPICSEEVHGLLDEVETGGRVQVSCQSGAFVEIIAEPAHAKVGLGFSYEIRTDDVRVIRVFRESPASRAGVEVGDQIATILGEPVKGMPEGRVRSLLNASGPSGLSLTLIKKSKQQQQVQLKDGPIYPLSDEAIP